MMNTDALTELNQVTQPVVGMMQGGFEFNDYALAVLRRMYACGVACFEVDPESAVETAADQIDAMRQLRLAANDGHFKLLQRGRYLIAATNESFCLLSECHKWEL